jgi:hypothetical protein
MVNQAGIFFLVMFAVGVICLSRPDFVQRIAASTTRWGVSGRIPALHRFVGSRVYLFNVRVVGVLALLGAFSLLWMILKAR